MSKKLKKIILNVALVVSIVLTMTGCSSTENKKTAADQDTTKESYEYVHRELGEPVYRTAAEEFAGGDGSEKYPYEISTAEELQYLADLLGDENDKAYDYRDKYYILTEDISLNDTSDYKNWSENRPKYDWKSIGKENHFSGVFDGNNHTISGLYLNEDLQSKEASDIDYGLFALLYGTVKNLTIKDAYVEVSGYSANVGMIAGDVAGGKILDCRVDGIVIAYDGNYGGIAGVTSGTISGCEFSGSVQAVKNIGDTYGWAAIGGIAGNANAMATNEEEKEELSGIIECVNRGTISAIEGKCPASAVGGIVGSGEGKITDCVNKGTVEGNEADTNGYMRIGGITGVFGVAAKSDDAKLSGCINQGMVISNGGTTGGIAGVVFLSDSRYEVSVVNCTNEGSVSVKDYHYGGIIGDVNCQANKITISGCINEAELQGKETAGIIYQLSIMKGEVFILNNENNGTITSDGQYAAGVLGYVDNLGDEWRLNIENCINTGCITSNQHVGGVVCFTTFYKSKENVNTSFTIKNCRNSGDLSSSTINGFMGGILAVDGFMETKTDISGCENTGDITFTEVWKIDKEDLKSEDENGNEKDTEIYTLSVTGGGIVGRIGEPLLLSVDADYPTAEKINVKDALVNINNCENSGKLSYQEPIKGDGISKDEFQKVVEKRWKVNMGGILGDCSCVDDYSVNLEKCKWTSERGIGNPELPDIE
ncbi:MAG: GLUG motif-containing protein [Lachnospiraceae bacterium]